MLVCINCGRSFENARYCMFCGTLLREKVVNYQTSGTLLRSNLDPGAVKPLQPAFVQADLKKNAVPAVMAHTTGYGAGAVQNLQTQVLTDVNNSTSAIQQENRDIYSSSQHEVCVPLETTGNGVVQERFEERRETFDSCFTGGFQEKHNSEPIAEPQPEVVEPEVVEPQKVEVMAEPQPEVVEPEITEPQGIETAPEPEREEPIKEDISFDEFMENLDSSEMVKPEVIEPQKVEVIAEPQPEVVEPEITEPQKTENVAELQEKTIVSEESVSHDIPQVQIQPPVTSFDVDPMFGEQPKMNFTVFDPSSSVNSAKPMSWLDRLKSRKKKK